MRWYQAAALQPFFRGHSSKCAKRREPWLFGEGVTSAIRTAVQQRWGSERGISPEAFCKINPPALRYCLLPYWYTLFHHCHVSGVPPLRSVLAPGAWCLSACQAAEVRGQRSVT